MKGKFRVLGCLVATSLLAAGALGYSGNQILDSLQRMGETGFKSGGSVAKSPTTYKPSKSRKGVDAAVAELASTAEERKAFRDSALAVVEGL